MLDAISDPQFRTWTRRLITVIAAIYLIQGLSLLVLDFNEAAEAAVVR